jgi:general secretion pathway protein D
VVIRDAAMSDALSLDRYDLMRGKEQIAQPPSSVVVPVNAAPVLPLPRRAEPAPAPAGTTPAPALVVPAPMVQ